MFKYVNIFVIFTCLTWSSLASANEKRISFGAMSMPDGSKYEIGFCAREKNEDGEGPGHAFVMLRMHNSANKLVDFVTAGFGPPKSKPVHGYGLISPEKYC